MWDNCAKQDIDTVIWDLKTFLQCLNDLHETLKYPVPDADFDDTSPPSFSKMALVRNIFSSRISNQFPLAAESLVDHLGRCNAERRAMVEETKRANAEIMARLPEITGSIHATDTGSVQSGSAGSTFHDSGLGTSMTQGPRSAALSVLTSSAGG